MTGVGCPPLPGPVVCDPARKNGTTSIVRRGAEWPGGSGAGDLASLDTRGAHVHPAATTVDCGPHRLDVRVPPALGLGLRPRHVVAEAWLLATDVTHASHGNTPGVIYWGNHPNLRVGNRGSVPDRGPVRPGESELATRTATCGHPRGSPFRLQACWIDWMLALSAVGVRQGWRLCVGTSGKSTT